MIMDPQMNTCPGQAPLMLLSRLSAPLLSISAADIPVGRGLLGR